MLKKTITYTDYNGLERTEDFRFNISKSELLKWNLKTPGGLAARLERISQKYDVPEITKFLEETIDYAYGIISDDGVRFIKDENLSKMFRQTDAYDKLFVDLLSDEKKLTAFINGLLPQELVNEANALNGNSNKPSLLPNN